MLLQVAKFHSYMVEQYTIIYTHMYTTSLEKAMTTHSSTLAWKIPWMEEPSRLQSMASLRVRHDRVTSLSLFTFMNWRRKWQPTPVFLPGESQGRRNLVGCCLWGRTESDTTDATATYYILIKSSPGGHLGCVLILANVNSAATNFGLQVSF